MIYLGDLTVDAIEKRLNIKFTKNEEEYLDSVRCSSANVENGKWHCFDIPFMMMCGDKETAIKVRDLLSKYENEMREIIQIGY